MSVKSLIRLALPAVALLIGYVDLWRGGITLAPLILILGYCVLIPWAIWTWPDGEEPAGATTHRASYGLAVGMGVLVLLLYVITLAPTTAMWDTSEYIAAAYTLGFPHPPGNPFFVLIGRVFSILPIAPTVAQRINLLAAMTSATAAVFWFLVAERIIARWIEQRWVQRVGGAVATIIGATAFTVWNQSVVNEKVYTIALAFTAVVSWLALQWLEQPEGPKADRKLVIAVYLLGLGYANHMAGFLPAPALAVAVLARRPITVMRWKLILVGVAALFLGLTPFIMQPIRAAHFPPINEGEVTACTGGKPELSCTLNGTTWERFEYNFNRKQYGKPSLMDRQAPFSAQIGMWWLYFKWQWLRDPSGHSAAMQQGLAVLFLLLGLGGAIVHWQKDRTTFWYFAPLMFSMTLLLIWYMNFKYGYSQGRPQDATPEVRDRDYFYIWSFSAWGIWAALGLLWVWDELRKTLANVMQKSAALVASPVLLLAFIPLITNRDAASRHRETFTRDWAIDLLNSVEPYGILITGGDDDTFPLWYAQEVEGVRKDVTVAVTSLLGLDWYGRQMIRRPIFEYDAARGPAIYRHKVWKKPEIPLVQLSLDEADRLPPYVELRGPQVFRKDSITATITAQYLTRDQILLLQMIKDTFPQRGIYISRGAGTYGNELGLQPYLVTQGFVRKLLPAPVKESKSTFSLAGFGWFDFDTTRSLWDSVYTGQKALLYQKRWIDPSSSSIPFSYLLTAAAMGEGYQREGKKDKANEMYAEARAVAKVAGLESFIQPGAETPAGGGDSPSR
jgi:hypothetical protein